MDQRITETMRERSRRPLRNKRYNRRTFSEEKRPPKRLFTPEIKKFLKDWLIRRRDNPYPNRDEKKTLAIQTGLTYIQVCNWFANWRRKLKNSGKESQRKSWGYLIKSYNNQVQGNVEHFSICSEDSIWQEPEMSEQTIVRRYDYGALVSEMKNVNVSTLSDYKIARVKYITDDDGNNLYKIQNNNNSTQSKYLKSPNNDKEALNPFAQNKHKNHIMEKYLRDCKKPESYTDDGFQETDDDSDRHSMISKWLESAANFIPNEDNYLNWTLMKSQKKKCKKAARMEDNLAHGKEELDAAEALTTLANAHAAALKL